MRMLGRRVNAQVGHLHTAQTVAGDHTLNSLDHDALGMCAFQNLLGRALLDAARVAGVPVVDLVVALVAGHLHLVGVDDDDIVTHVHVGGEGRLVLAAQDVGDDRGQATQNDAFGVDQDPLFLDVRRSSGEGFHIEPMRERARVASRISDGGLIAQLNRCVKAKNKLKTIHFQCLTNCGILLPQ